MMVVTLIVRRAVALTRSGKKEAEAGFEPTTRTSEIRVLSSYTTPPQAPPRFELGIYRFAGDRLNQTRPWHLLPPYWTRTSDLRG
eukprot:2769520-Rhodomonas_salina.1